MNKSKLTFWTKVLYGAGDWDISAAGMLRSIFYAIYLTDVVGPVGAAYLSGTVLLAWLFPLNREKHARNLSMLEKRRSRTVRNQV